MVFIVRLENILDNTHLRRDSNDVIACELYNQHKIEFKVLRFQSTVLTTNW